MAIAFSCGQFFPELVGESHLQREVVKVRGWTGWSLRSLPTQTILWFCGCLGGNLLSWSIGLIAVTDGHTWRGMACTSVRKNEPSTESAPCHSDTGPAEHNLLCEEFTSPACIKTLSLSSLTWRLRATLTNSNLINILSHRDKLLAYRLPSVALSWVSVPFAFVNSAKSSTLPFQMTHRNLS